jgi:hypothetical protein
LRRKLHGRFVSCYKRADGVMLLGCGLLRLLSCSRYNLGSITEVAEIRRYAVR